MVTSKDVALYAGVSQSTVSRAFSENSRLSDKTRKKVLETAKQMGYKPNAIARSLISARTDFIGVVKGPSYNPMFSELLTALVSEIQQTDHQIIYFEALPHQTIDDILSRILQYRVEGIILLYATLSSEVTKVCRETGIPVLQMLRYSTNAQANAILPDNAQGAADAADHLIEQGYRHFAYITGELNSSSNMERQFSFVNRLTERSCKLPLVLPGDYTYESGYRAMQELAKKTQLPCGVLCGNDLMAMGVLDAAKEFSLRVPEDIGVIGFDDNFMSSWPTYQLTSLRQPTEQIARHGVELLLNSIRDPQTEPEVVRYGFELIKRASTRRET